MTENPDPRTAFPPPRRFGVAAELDRIQKSPPQRRPEPRPADGSRTHPLDHRIWQCRSRSRRGPIKGRAWAHLRFWWAAHDARPGGLRRRMRCRRGRHDIRGGQQMQLGSRFVNVERCCVWCGAKPPEEPFPPGGWPRQP